MAKDLLNMKLATILFGLLALMIITPRHCMANNFLMAPNGLREGEALVYGNYMFVLSTWDCQLGLYDNGVAVWTSNPPAYTRGCRASIQRDGNFVLKNAYGNVLWSSGSGQEGTNCYLLVLQGDRNVVIYGRGASGGGAIWATGTNIPTSTSILGQNSTATIVTNTAATGADVAVMVN